MNGENTMRDALRTIVTMIEHDLPAEMPNEIYARAEWYAILIGQFRATALAALEQDAAKKRVRKAKKAAKDQT